MNRKAPVACNFNYLIENEGLLNVRCYFCPRYAMLARCLMSSRVRLSVCLSVTSRSCAIKTATRRITQTTLHDSPWTP